MAKVTFTSEEIASFPQGPPGDAGVVDLCAEYGVVCDNKDSSGPANSLAINVALQDIFAVGGGEAKITRPGVCYVSEQIVIPTRVRLSGVGKRSTIIKAANEGVASAGIVSLGSGGLTFDCRIENLTVHAVDYPASICLTAQKANQQSGARDCLLTNFSDTGAVFDGPSNADMMRCEVYGTNGFNHGIKAKGSGGGFLVQDCTINADSGGGTNGIYLQSGTTTQLIVLALAAEHVTDAIFLEGGGVACVMGVGIGPSVKNIVHIGSVNGAAKVLTSLRGAGAGRVALRDDAKGISSGSTTSVEFAVFSDGTWFTNSVNIPLKLPQHYIYMSGLPTSNPGGSGRLWNNSGTLSIT